MVSPHFVQVTEIMARGGCYHVRRESGKRSEYAIDAATPILDRARPYPSMKSSQCR
jgi:hypothetical protein